MNQPSRPNPTPPSSSTSQIGTIVVGAVAGLAVCAIGSAILAQWNASQAAAQTQVTS